jgi:hypothetical protein
MVVNLKNADYDEFIGRPSIYGNPFIIGVHGSRKEVCRKHILWCQGAIKGPNEERPPTHAQIMALKGKILGCYCAPAQCHGDYYAEVANKKPGGLFR